MGLLRSQDLDLYEILVPKDSDWDVINELGHLNCLHFINLNKNEQPHHLKYTMYVKRAEESERKLEEIQQYCQRYRVKMKTPEDVPQFLEQIKSIRTQKGKAASLLFTEIEKDINDKVSFLNKQSKGIEQMVAIYKTLIAKINVLSFAAKLFNRPIPGPHQRKMDPEQQFLEQGREPLLASDHMKLTYVGGTILKEDQMRFSKFLFRATRGKAFVQFEELKIQPGDRLKNIYDYDGKLNYIVMFEEGHYLKDRVQKICGSFQDNIFDISRNSLDLELGEAIRQKEDTKTLLKQTKQQLKQYLQDINVMQGSEQSLLQIYKWFIVKEKALYNTLNHLKSGDKILIGLMWCPSKMRDKLTDQLQTIREDRQINPPQIKLVEGEFESLIKPTYIELNEFTWAFQEIVNTYGIPNYKEVNPAIFTIVTFPFQFGVMFGDIIHGALLFLFATLLCFSKRKPGTAFGELGRARHLLLLMGFFATFCGFIYNDMTSIPLYLFGHSCYEIKEGQKEAIQKEECVYPVGIDPVWYLSINELTYINSLKMKLAVIIGVAQMALGVCMKGLNAIYYGRNFDFFFEFLPQIIMLLALFGFMDLLIFIKWMTNYESFNGVPPSIITTMINMCLNFGELPPGAKDTPFIQDQTFWMRFLLLTVIICVPWMLFFKPIHEYNVAQRNAHVKRSQSSVHIVENKVYTAINDERVPHKDGQKPESALEQYLNEQSHSLEKEGGGRHGEFGEIFIHQLIETIEFVLGTVSNTASYLRLWALSLAHSQLAKVFFDQTLTPGFKSGSFITVFLGFFIFLGATVGVLMLMDLLEAFLHTLRLHWVEFQNKFYKGQGIKFAPFSIEAVLQEEQRRAMVDGTNE